VNGARLSEFTLTFGLTKLQDVDAAPAKLAGGKK